MNKLKLGWLLLTFFNHQRLKLRGTTVYWWNLNSLIHWNIDLGHSDTDHELSNKLRNDLDNDPVADFGRFGGQAVNRNTGTLSYNFLNDFHLPSSKPPIWLVGINVPDRPIDQTVETDLLVQESWTLHISKDGPVFYAWDVKSTDPLFNLFLALAIRKLRFEKVGSNVIHLRWEAEDQFAQYIARV